MSYAHPEFLISTSELAAKLGDESLRIFDTSVLLHHDDVGYRAEPGREDYLKEHIAGAGFINLCENWSDTTSGFSNTLPSIDALCSAIGKDGIGNDNPVVLYSSGHLMWATRAWWLLRYAGHNNVRVLNGSLQAWRSAELPTRGGEEAYPPATFTPSLRPELFATTKEVAEGMDGAVCTINACRHRCMTVPVIFTTAGKDIFRAVSRFHFLTCCATNISFRQTNCKNYCQRRTC